MSRISLINKVRIWKKMFIHWMTSPDAVTQAYRDLELSRVRRRLQTVPIAICPKIDPAQRLELDFQEFLRLTCQARIGGPEMFEQPDALFVRTALLQTNGSTALELEIVSPDSSLVNHFPSDEKDLNHSATFLQAARFVASAARDPLFQAAA